jgi:heme exporter protein C
MDFKKNWWKILAVLLLAYVILAGMLLKSPEIIPFVPKLKESIRNLFYHVPMWFVMQICFTISVVQSILYLKSNNFTLDIKAEQYVKVGLLFGGLGMLTGMEWASIQWGSPWSNDPKQIGSGLTLLIYLAYSVLRNSVKEENQKAKLAAVYNVFAFALLIPLLYIIPSHIKSLHPGKDEQNQVLGTVLDLSPNLQLIFIPAILGWILLGLWVAQLCIRTRILTQKKLFEH